MTSEVTQNLMREYIWANREISPADPSRTADRFAAYVGEIICWGRKFYVWNEEWKDWRPHPQIRDELINWMSHHDIVDTRITRTRVDDILEALVHLYQFKLPSPAALRLLKDLRERGVSIE